MTSLKAQAPTAKSALYAMGKAASDASVLALADELRGSGATANLVVVDSIDTPESAAEGAKAVREIHARRGDRGRHALPLLAARGHDQRGPPAADRRDEPRVSPAGLSRYFPLHLFVHAVQDIRERKGAAVDGRAVGASRVQALVADQVPPRPSSGALPERTSYSARRDSTHSASACS